MDARRGRTRSVLVVVGVALATLAALVMPGPASASPAAPEGSAAAAQAPPPGIVPPGEWAQPMIDWMVGWIERAEAVLPERYPPSYSDGGTELQAMGFYNIGATAPGGYDHWVNASRIADSHYLNADYAEALVYKRNASGTWELQAGMFMLPAEMEPADVPALLSWMPGWHGHPELCIGTDGRVKGITDPNAPNCPPGTRQATTPLMLHAWIVDPGCGHRFGGVGVGGVHCDVHPIDGGHGGH